MFRALATCGSLEEQRAVCDRFSRRIGLVAGLLQLLLPLLCPFAGVPASQMTLGGAGCVEPFVQRVFYNTHIAKVRGRLRLRVRVRVRVRG